jgi:general stress protein YciG
MPTRPPKAASRAAAAFGRKGGQVKTAKGFSTMDPERRSEIAKAAAAKRWGPKPIEPQ